MSEKNRKVSITTPLGEDELIFQNLIGHEEMGRLFEFDIELVREQKKGPVNVALLLGQDMTVKLEMSDGSIRYFNGAAIQFKHTGFSGGLYHYHAVLRPWLWFLTRKTNCRIFQEKNIPDIVKSILQEHAYVEVEYKLEGTYEILDYCVQYRESDFAFISRLMEHTGIFYYFKHEDRKHTLVVTDNNHAYQTISNYSEIPYFPPENQSARERDHIFEWLAGHQIQSGAVEINDFDFEAPSSDLTAKSSHSQGYMHDDLEVYDYPGAYTEVNVGTQRTDVRVEELQTQYTLINGHGNARGIQPGMEFTLNDFYFAEENVPHVVVSANYTINGDDLGSNGHGQKVIFDVNFVALNSKQQFRPRRMTPKPVISGSQTAIVVGKEGEEIWTDKYGRIKVQFHWDREGGRNENSSCWVRVSHPTAGKNWGWISLPRIDQEVIVSFLEGDPDQPMITGRVYNADQMPPYALPENQTQSGIKTRSSKGGVADNYNEIRFEDKKDEEELYVHAEKDCNRVVENNDTLKVGFEKTDAGDQTIDIYNNRTVTLEEGNDLLTVKKGNHTLTVNEGDHALNIDAGKRTAKVEGNDATTISSGNHSIDVSSGSSSLEAGTTISQKAGTSVALEAGTSMVLKATSSIELKVGGNSIKIDNSGITIKGIMVKVEGSATTEVKSPMTTVKGDGMLTLKGGVTMIN